MEKLLKGLGILIGGGLLGTLLLWLVFLLPTETMQLHIYQSLPILESEFEESQVISGYEATLTGNFTDCLMLENAIYQSPEHSLYEQMMMMYRGESSEGSGWATGESLVRLLEGGNMAREVDYARYWHGYLVFLKPLLLFTNLQNIRMANAMLQSLLLCVFVGMCFRRGQGKLGVIFGIAQCFLYPFTMYFSLSLSICYYLLMVAVLVQITWHETFRKRVWYPYFFLIAGMCTSYFDFLTYPLVTLGFPLGILFVLSEENWKQQIKQMAGYSLLWGVGYLGMWAQKWLITDITLQTGTIKDALLTLGERTGTVSEVSALQGYFQVLQENLGHFGNKAFLFLLCGTAAWLTMGFIRNKIKRKAIHQKPITGITEAIPFIILSLFPFGWFLVTQNHSMEHGIFTCKIISISVFAFFCIFLSQKERD